MIPTMNPPNGVHDDTFVILKLVWLIISQAGTIILIPTYLIYHLVHAIE